MRHGMTYSSMHSMKQAHKAGHVSVLYLNKKQKKNPFLLPHSPSRQSRCGGAARDVLLSERLKRGGRKSFGATGRWQKLCRVCYMVLWFYVRLLFLVHYVFFAKRDLVFFFFFFYFRFFYWSCDRMAIKGMFFGQLEAEGKNMDENIDHEHGRWNLEDKTRTEGAAEWCVFFFFPFAGSTRLFSFFLFLSLFLSLLFVFSS